MGLPQSQGLYKPPMSHVSPSNISSNTFSPLLHLPRNPPSFVKAPSFIRQGFDARSLRRDPSTRDPCVETLRRAIPASRPFDARSLPRDPSTRDPCVENLRRAI